MAMGRNGMRGVATGRSPIAPPCLRAIAAATCRWQFRPWHIPIETRVNPLIVFRSADVAIAASSVSGRELLATADDRLRRRELVDAGPNGVQPLQRPAERLLVGEPHAKLRRALVGRVRAERLEVARHAQGGDPSLVDRDIGALHAGAVSGGRDAFDARSQPLVADDDRATEVLVVR